MALVEWNDSLSVGIHVIDEEHKKLVSMLNELYDGMRAGKGKETLGGILDRLVAYTAAHFKHEEAFFEQTNYPEGETHKKQHEDLTAQVLDIQKRFKTGAAGVLSLEVMNFLRKWLVEHIQGSDQKYTQHLVSNGIT